MSHTGKITFDFNWEDPRGARGEELRATWARLRILVDDDPVLKVEDIRTRSVRDYLYLPLYPLAEWMAVNWWFLLAEVGPSRAKDALGFSHRHNLRFAREGFALPNLSLVPTGETTQIEWSPVDLPGCEVSFLATGKANLDTEQVRDDFARFIGAVAGRLDEKGLVGTTLQTEWDAIQQTETAEQEFCLTAAALGQDPYALDHGVSEAILTAHETLPPETFQDFVQAADPTQLVNQANLLHQWIGDLQNTDFELGGLRDLRGGFQGRAANGTPWQQGYAAAGELRRHLQLGDRTNLRWEDLPAVLRVPPSEFKAAFQCHDDTDLLWLNAVAASNRTGSPALAIGKRHGDSAKFAFSRALFEYLTQPESSACIVTSARSARQQRNRAFAAEFLAPAGLIHARLSGDHIYSDEVDDLATEFGVFSSVIRHQIENHRLAEVESC